MRWLQWLSTGVNAAGNPSTVPQQVWVVGSVQECLRDLWTELETFPIHEFNARWHRNQLQIGKGNVTPGVLLMILDYSQKFTIRSACEIQSAYWDAVSVTIHGIVCYYNCPKCNKVIKHDFIQLSNVKEHEHFLVRAGLQKVLEHLAELEVPVTSIVQFTDNCLHQYKSQRPFVEISRSAIPVTRIFFGENHGKSDCDTLFSSIKRQFTSFIYQKNGRFNPNPFMVTNGETLYQMAKMYMEQEANESNHHAITFDYFAKSDLRLRFDPTAATVEGTKTFHSVRNTGTKLELQSRRIGCACKGCMTNPPTDCSNSELVDDWADHLIKPLKSSAQYETTGNTI
jgi:hypothetical protein